jgi:hypothetical protein
VLRVAQVTCRIKQLEEGVAVDLVEAIEQDDAPSAGAPADLELDRPVIRVFP